MLSMLLENLGLSCPHSEGNAETGREEGRGLTKGSPAQDATASAAACEGGEHRLEGGQTHLPAPSSLGHQGRTDSMTQAQALVSLSDADSLFCLLQVLQRVSVTVISLLTGLLRYSSQKHAPTPGLLHWLFPLPEGSLSASLPLELLYPTPKTPRLASAPSPLPTAPLPRT